MWITYMCKENLHIQLDKRLSLTKRCSLQYAQWKCWATPCRHGNLVISQLWDWRKSLETATEIPTMYWIGNLTHLKQKSGQHSTMVADGNQDKAAIFSTKGEEGLHQLYGELMSGELISYQRNLRQEQACRQLLIRFYN